MAILEFFSPKLNPATLERQKMICLNCDSPVSMKITRDFTTEICEDGCLLWYPPRPDREYGVRKFISKETYLHNKYIEREKFIREMKQKGIKVDDKTLQTSKTHRSLTYENGTERGEYFKEKEKEFDEKIKEEREKIEKANMGFKRK